MASVPPVRELERICGGEGRDPGAPRDFRIAYAVLVRRVSIRITWLVLHTRLSANGVTLLGIGIGIAGALMLAWNEFWPIVLALVLLQLSFVVDYSDGEVARYRAQERGTVTDAGGAFLDWIGHPYIPALAIGALAYGAFTESGHDWLLLAALVAILSVVRVPYSARDHVLLGLFRDRPDLREPSDEEEGLDLEPVEAAEELLARMLEYHRYRQAAEHLRDRLEAEHGYRYRSAPLPPELRRISIETADAAYDPERLAEALGGLLTVPPPLDLRHVRRPAVSVEQRLRHLRDLLSSRSRFSFDDAVVGADRLTEAVTLFALLELYKAGEAKWEQEVPFGPITVVSS